MPKQQILLFSKSIPNARLDLEPRPADLVELSKQVDVAVENLGSGWAIVSASTQMTHFTMGNLPVIGLILTVIVAKVS